MRIPSSETSCQNVGRWQRPRYSRRKTSIIELWSRKLERVQSQECGTGEGIDVPPTVTEPRIHAPKGAIFRGMDSATLEGALRPNRGPNGPPESGTIGGTVEASMRVSFSCTSFFLASQASSNSSSAPALSTAIQATHFHEPPQHLHWSDVDGSRRGA